MLMHVRCVCRWNFASSSAERRVSFFGRNVVGELEGGVRRHTVARRAGWHRPVDTVLFFFLGASLSSDCDAVGSAKGARESV